MTDHSPRSLARTVEHPHTIELGDGHQRIVHAKVTVPLNSDSSEFFAAYATHDRYETWAPNVQGSAHWLTVRSDGVGSQFIRYDKPGMTHLAHFGTVTAFEAGHHFEWQAPFSEWQRATIGFRLEIDDTGAELTATETCYFEVQSAHVPILSGFLDAPDLDTETFETFLEARLTGLDTLLQRDDVGETDLHEFFGEDRDVADDWAGRISEGEWVRVLYADGEFDFDASIEAVFNPFTRFARYADWTRRIHVGAEWYEVKAGGTGSKFMIWEKVGDRHVMHYSVITEFEQNRTFAWRAPFAEWGKVFVGTKLVVEPRDDGGTHAYHVLYVDIPVEYLPVFGGFGTLPGFDIEFETHHIYEEATGFQRLLENGEFTDEELSYLFEEDRTLARDWPLQEGRRWPEETLTLDPDRVITMEQMMVELSETFADTIPSPAFTRTYRDLNRTRHYNPDLDGEGR